ncbi:hypothetical protein REPUB_Repub03eG0229100 [Reevesia pubescens]
MELSFEMEAVIEFLKKNGLKEAEKALEEDMMEKNEVVASDFDKLLFPMPPPVRIPATFRRSEVVEKVKSSDGSGSDCDEFVSLKSSTTDVCSSDFVNPYGLHSASQADSDTSSDRLSQFGTARDYPDLDMQNDLYWHDEKDGDYFMTPCFAGSDFYGCPSQDKFVTTSETEKQHDNTLSSHNKSEGFQTDTGIDYLDKPCVFNIASTNGQNEVQVMDYYPFDKCNRLEGDVERELKSCAYGCSLPLFESCDRPVIYDENPVNFSHMISRESDLDDFQLKADGVVNADYDGASEHISRKNLHLAKRGSNDWIDGFKGDSDLLHKIAKSEHMDELLMYSNEDECEVFNLRIIHRKNRTGFEENKDLPIVLNTVIAGRYYVTEYLGSAAFSKAVQAHDLLMGIDVCLKIIKNDKDFFDQSLDEIKLLTLVNKQDPGDEHHILRLYDYFYHQEHLFIVCELLRANLYEFQKFNQESGGEAYFTLSRLQVCQMAIGLAKLFL